MNFIKSLFLTGWVTLFMSCSTGHRADREIDQSPKIFPDYKDITVPCNIAPLNFEVEGAKSLYAEISCDGNVLLSVDGNKEIKISSDEWRELMTSCAGKELKVELSVFDEASPEGVRYRPFSIFVSKDSIDPYIAYRLIEPGYESWQDMKICQRRLSDFTEEEILKTDRNGCINCHSFHNYSPENMLIHYRKKGGGTLFVEGDKLKKIDLKAIAPGKQGVYLMWHPSGKYVIFSSNATSQSFYATGKDPIEVYDSESDLILYRVDDEKVATDQRFCGDSLLQTFPAWSPDGKSLYYCVSKKVKSSDELNKLHYSLCRVGFDAETGTFAEKIDTIIDAEKGMNSISFPRISPEGRYLLFTRSGFATFPIWHSDSELEMIDLQTGKFTDTSILNSKEAESYHSWSSNGKWVIFSSRRLDGRYTRLFIAHFDGKGRFSRPFLLPQESAEHNIMRLESYNIPEFIKAPVRLDKKKAMELFK